MKKGKRNKEKEEKNQSIKNIKKVKGKQKRKTSSLEQAMSEPYTELL